MIHDGTQDLVCTVNSYVCSIIQNGKNKKSFSTEYECPHTHTHTHTNTHIGYNNNSLCQKACIDNKVIYQTNKQKNHTMSLPFFFVNRFSMVRHDEWEKIGLSNQNSGSE